MRRAGRIAAALLLAAAPPAAAQDAAWSSFVVRIGADTFAVESYARTPALLEGTLTGHSVGRLAYRVELGAGAATRSLTLHAWRPGASEDSAAGQVVRLEQLGDSAVVRIATPAGEQRQRLDTREGSILYVNPSFALTEQIVLRARAVGGDTVEVPILLLQGGGTVPATVVRMGADSAAIRIAGSEMRVAVAADGRLLGGAIPAQNLTFERVEGRVSFAGAMRPPDYSAPEGAPYTAEEVTVTTPAGHALVGTLTRPAGAAPVPAVVTITGSGAQDRDQGTPAIPRWRAFREIADTLSRRGIAVLRLDDRGTGASGGDFATATSADFADDARAALAYLRGRPDIDGGRLAVLGHSEGGLIGPMVAASDPGLRALVVSAGPARTGREIIHDQQRYAVEHMMAVPAESRDSVLAAARIELEEIAARNPWMRFFLDHDPRTVARTVRTPVLIVQGSTDRQVPEAEAEMLAEAFREGGNPDVTVRLFPGINHLLLADPDGSPAGYGTLPDHRVSREVLGAITEWLVERLR